MESNYILDQRINKFLARKAKQFPELGLGDKTAERSKVVLYTDQRMSLEV